MGCDPEYRPGFGVAAAEFVHVGHIPVLGKIGVLDLLALAAVGIRELIAGAVHYLRQFDQTLVAEQAPHPANLGREKHPIYVQMLILRRSTDKLHTT